MVSDCLSGFHHFLPLAKGRLSKPWRLFKIWRKAERPKRCPPMPECVAVCLALALYGMLRTGELLQLRWSQLLFGPQDLVIQLGLTKTGLRRAIDENVVARDEIPRLLARTLWDIRRKQQRLNELVWIDGSKAFRDQFRALVAFFQLPPSFKPYSLRRGGATADFRHDGSMEKTLLRGRWGSTGAARNYVQEGLGLDQTFIDPPLCHPPQTLCCFS